MNEQRTRIVIFLVFLLSVVVMEIVVRPGPKTPLAPPPTSPQPFVQIESQPLVAADLLALNAALEDANSAPAVTVHPRQPEYNEGNVRAE